MRALALLLAAAVLLAAPSVASAQRGPILSSAASAIVIDGRNGEVMYAKRPDARRAIASTTKLMTALLLLERARPGDVFTASDYDALPAESRINLRPGERMSVRDLLEALLLESANDAAATIADNVSGTRDAFVAEMNARAAQLGLDDTSYANPVGLDDAANFSTARDLAKLTRVLLDRPRFARVVDLPEAELESGAVPRVIDNRNNLIASTPWVSGVKTGHTEQAGYVLVGSATGSGGAKVISVVLGEPSEPARDAETLALLSWGLKQFRRVRAVSPERALARARIRYYDDETARLVPRRAVRITVRSDERIERRVRSAAELEGPMPAGERAGMVTILVDGRPVRRVALVTAADVPQAGALRVLTSGLGVPLTLLLGLAILVAALALVLKLRTRFRIVR